MRMPEREELNRRMLAEHLLPLLEQYDVKDRRHGVIYLDHQPDNIVTAGRILASLSMSLGLPANVVRAQLVECGWLNDVRKTSPPSMEEFSSSPMEETSSPAEKADFSDASQLTEDADEDTEEHWRD
jgi:hypothetical protein